MSALLARRARLTRVRRVQHVQAAAAAAHAEHRAAGLEATAERLGEINRSLTPTPGMIFGSALSNAAELAMRLDQVRDGMTDAILGARRTALEQAALRLAARIRQESAERLQERAVADAAAVREKRVQALGSRRRLAEIQP